MIGGALRIIFTFSHELSGSVTESQLSHPGWHVYISTVPTSHSHGTSLFATK
jgi:hypothetical protein